MTLIIHILLSHSKWTTWQRWMSVDVVHTSGIQHPQREARKTVTQNLIAGAVGNSCRDSQSSGNLRSVLPDHI